MKYTTFLAAFLKKWTSLAAQMIHDIDMVTTMHPLTTETNIASVVNLNTVYKNDIAKKIILEVDNIIISPSNWIVGGDHSTYPHRSIAKGRL